MRAANRAAALLTARDVSREWPEHPITIDDGSRVVHDADMAMGKREGDEAA
jgi:hypothetical protein